jgi:hypothetical protein
VPCEQRHVVMVRREKGGLTFPILDPRVAELYKDAGWETEVPDPPDFNLARWLVATQLHRRQRRP